MSRYYLRLRFDPDHDVRRRSPKTRQDGTVDQYDLGYVQNVVAGQVLAEWEPADAPDGNWDVRFLFDKKTPPLGSGCLVDPTNPDRLLAETNGHVVIENGRITVKKRLSAPGDVDFHTGNIVFVGDVLVAGSIRSGFEVSGRNVTVQGAVEAARVRAMGSVSCEGGVMGGGRGEIQAGGSLRARFCENAELRAGKNILIDGGCMHSDLFVGEKLAVKGRLIGGEIFCGGSAFVGEQLGGGLRTGTKLLLGYPPELIHADRALTGRIKELHARLESLRKEIARGGKYASEAMERRQEADRKLRLYRRQRAKLWTRNFSVSHFPSCRVIVPGRIGANVEIGIGEAFFSPPVDASDVIFRYEDGEIRMESPAIRK